MFDRIEKFLFEISLWLTVIGRKECEQIFEHTTFPQIEIILRLLFAKR